MKNIISACLCIFFLLDEIPAQLSFRLTGGFSPAQHPSNVDLFLYKHTLVDQFYFNMNEIKPQWYGGITTHLRFRKSDFFTEAKLLYSYQQCSYTCHFTIGAPYHPAQNMTMQETESMIFLPVNVGVRFDRLSVASGVSAITSIYKKSELASMDGFESSASLFSMGWQSSAKINFDRFVCGVEYQGRISRVGEGTEIHGQSLALRHVPGKWVFLVEYILN